jgi:hypothetical protein
MQSGSVGSPSYHSWREARGHDRDPKPNQIAGGLTGDRNVLAVQLDRVLSRRNPVPPEEFVQSASVNTGSPARPHKVDDLMSAFGKRPAVDRANDPGTDYKHEHRGHPLLDLQIYSRCRTGRLLHAAWIRGIFRLIHTTGTKFPPQMARRFYMATAHSPQSTIHRRQPAQEFR